MSTNMLRLGAFLFIAATLGLCRMLPFPRYNNYPLSEDDQDISNDDNILKISTQENPDSNSSPPPRIQHHESNSGQQQSDRSTNDPELSIFTIHNQNNPAQQPSHLSTSSLELLHARRALKELKSLLGPARLRALLSDEIRQGNQQWHDILSASSYPFNSNTRPTQEFNLKLSQVHLLATQPCNSTLNYTSASFLAWFLTNAFTPSSPQLWAGHPEHYGINLSPNSDGALRGEILEPRGSANDRLKPWMRPLKSYPLQMIGDETLMDGSEKVIANLHYAYRDIPAHKGCDASYNPSSSSSKQDIRAEGKKEKRGSGIEAILTMYMPDATPDDVVQGLSEHLEIEYYNWLRWAYEDIKSGAFKPT